ncbi:hypothetical protein [Deinococcus aquaedulcis]|uniref:hypothetical protein n=1 Tax=Deinococcus aquaedulcis TaxID=2840455 RepID=UPI001C8327F0|nr:hypothetical protein [Deinococcus aquaedulcis]
MQRLNAATLPALLARHHHFCDGVIHAMTLTYVDASLHGAIRLEVMDQDAASGWTTLELILEGAAWVQVREGPPTNVVMSPFGVHIEFWQDTICLDFSPVTDVDYTMADFKRSTFAVQAAVGWVVEG